MLKAMSYKPLALIDKLNISKTQGNRMKDFQETQNIGAEVIEIKAGYYLFFKS
jgi:hypothetical protein